MHTDTARLHIGDELHEPVQTITDYLPQALRFSGQPKSRDITKEFTEASSELGQGQLIKDEYFTLFESVGALEIMDPKMDSGFMMPEADAAVDNFDPLRPMLPEELLGIMDQMLCYEMAWHDGYPLSQTLFTSLHFTSITPQEYKYLERVVFKSKQKRPLNPLISDVLRAYCIGLMKSCDSVIADIISEHYYEEEDFVTQTFTQYLLSDIDDAAIIAVLEAASQTLESIDLPENVKEAFAARLDLRTLMLKAYQPLPARFHAEKSQLWQEVLKAVVKVNETVSLGKAVPDAFSERVQRHLASSTPPRPMIIISWEEAYPKLRKLCEDNIEAYRIATIEDPSPSNIIRFVEDFSSRKPSTYSRSIIQGLLFKDSKFLGQVPHYDVLLTDIASLVLAADPLLSPTNWEIELPSDPRHRIARKIDEFMAKAIEEYLNIPRMLSQNRCRTRRTLNQSIAILDSLQAEAELIDSAIHTIIEEICSTSGSSSPSSARAFADSVEQLPYFPLAAWTYNHKLTISIQTVLLGFETEVYLPDEHGSMYAFLAFLAQTQEEHLGHIDFFAHRRAQRLAKETRDQGLVEEVVANRAFLKLLIAKVRARRFLSEALKGLYSLFQTLHLIPTPPRPYSSSSLRHELRMKPFLPIGTPSLPSLSTLSPQPPYRSTRSIASILAGIETPLKLAKSDLNTLRTAAPAIGHFKGCEKGWANEIKGLLGSSIGIGVAVAGIRGACEGVGVVDVGHVHVEGRTEGLRQRVRIEIPVPEKRFAAGWAVPKVVEIKV